MTTTWSWWRWCLSKRAALIHTHTHTVNVIEKLLYKENKPEVHVALPSLGHTDADLARRAPAGGWWLAVAVAVGGGSWS